MTTDEDKNYLLNILNKCFQISCKLSSIMKYLFIFIFQLSHILWVSSVSLHYNKNNHFYDELLISISPDVPDPGVIQIIVNKQTKNNIFFLKEMILKNL